jgi:predicted regulator of Ras-like GTPase activity (Roadblock/LC7/MglB family)
MVFEEVSKALEKPGVLGVMCVDKQGLCLHAEGSATTASAGAIAELSKHALALSGEGAVATVEGPQGKVVLARSDDVTTALFMEPFAARSPSA